MKKLWHNHLRLILVFCFILVMLLLAEFTGLREQFNPQQIKEVFMENFLISSSLFILLFALGNLLQVPGLLFLATATVTLGRFHGYFLTLTAAVVSSIVSYYLIRVIGGDSLRNLKFSWVNRVLNEIDKKPIKVIFLLRVVFQSAPPLNYALALSGVGFKNYLIGTLLGMPIPIFFFTFFIDEVGKRIL